LQPDGARRRFRRQGRSAERLLHEHGRPRLVQRGSGAVPLAQALGHHRCCRTVPASRQTRRADRGTGEKMTRRTLITFAVFAAVGTAVAAQAPDRSKPPATGPAPALKLPAIQKRQLKNGLPVWIVELHKVPVAQINLVVLGGSADDPAGKYGVASLTAMMLEEGAGSRSSLEIADAIDFLGADLAAGSGIDSTGIRLHVPIARLGGGPPDE